MKNLPVLVMLVCVLAFTTVALPETQETKPAQDPPATVWGQIEKGVKGITDWIWPIAVSMAAVGTLAMALIQTAKDLLGARRRFQITYLRKWLEEKANSFHVRAKEFRPVNDYLEGLGAWPEKEGLLKEKDVFQVDPKRAEKDMIELATSGDHHAFYDLPIEQLAGQMNAAAQAALNYPKAHRDLLWCLAHLAEPQDILLVLAPPRRLLEPARRALNDDEKQLVDEFVAARNRLTHQVQRAIDGLQIAAGAAWKRRMQVWSMGLSAVLGVLALRVATKEFEAGPSIGMFILTGFLAGFLAPVARDLVAALQSLRK